MQLTNKKVGRVNISFPGSALALIISLTLFDALASELESFDFTSVLLDGQKYTLEIAKTSRQRQQGLMFRQQLKAKSGMIFVYPIAAQHRIWMKNTLIPLTVIWLDRTATVVGIKQLIPCDADPCQSYGINSNSKYVLEMPANYYGLNLGDQVLDILDIK